MITKGQRVMAAGAVTAIVEPALMMAHAGGLGAIVGLGIGALTYAYVDDLERVMRGEEANTPLLAPRNSNGKPSIIYRALNGKSVRSECEGCVEEAAPQATLTRAQVEDVQRTTERLPMPAAPEPKASRQPIERLADSEEDIIPLPRSQRGKFVFSEVLQTFKPTVEQVFLARTFDGQPLYCNMNKLFHIAIAGSTGNGKSSIIRLLMTQLCALRVNLLLLNPHYTGYDLENGEDWTPFEPYLLHAPQECRKYEVIEHYLSYIAKTLIPTRLEKRAQSLPLGKPYFVIIDELPSIVREVKEVPDYMRLILEEGRKVGVFLISAAQDFLVKSISPESGGGSIRDCYRTVYYVGGDATTASTMLKIPAKEVKDNELGEGVVMMRGTSPEVKAPVKVLVPYVDNDAIYRLLGPSTYNANQSLYDMQDNLPSPASIGDIEMSRAVGGIADAIGKAARRTEEKAQSRQVNTDDLESGIPEQVAHQPYRASAENTYRQKTTGMEQITPNRSMQLRLVKAKDLYEQGVKSSEHLAQAMGINAREGSLLFKTLRENGLIEDTRKTQAMEPLPEVPETPVVTPIIKDKGTRADDIDINLAITAWNNGWNSVEKLQNGFGITNYQAQRLRERILKQAGGE